jgi:Ca2+-binding RTX toxin-like protein
MSPPGVQMTVDANRLRVGEDFTFNGSAETDGKFFIYGGGGTDNLLGGSGNDTFYFGEALQFGATDHVDGGAAASTSSAFAAITRSLSEPISWSASRASASCPPRTPGSGHSEAPIITI